jgi:hypothetical protein
VTTTQSRPPATPDPIGASGGQVSEKVSRQVGEAARETEWRKPSFGKELFLGRFRMDLIEPWPETDPERAAHADAFLDKVASFVRDNVDNEQI